MSTQSIEEMYKLKCATPSDINQLLPILKEFASKCDHITEMGVRDPTSTYAFLAGNPKKLICYDIVRHLNIDVVEVLAAVSSTKFKFYHKDVLQVEIEPTDFLFIDTFHTSAQLEKELALHAHKVKKYIGFHDTATFWEKGEDAYEEVKDRGTADGTGLKYALEAFLEVNKDVWEIEFITRHNNGLTIIKKLP